jgi:predicted type IV restriction endonuclease
MRKLLIAVFGGALALGGLGYTVHAAEEAKPESKTVEGELIDTYCYTKGDAKGEDHAACAKKCAASGIPVAVLVDGKAWTLTTNPRPLADDMAKTARVTGSMNTETQTIVPEKVEVKDGENWKEVKLKDAHHGGSEQGEFKEIAQ